MFLFPIQSPKNFRLVIFIDDLDRCTPERALEILESIKTFFDIEGIVFVLGIDPSTIDPIIKTKYGVESKIDGMKYLQKMVQLSYPMPLWNPPQLSYAIKRMIKQTGLPKNKIQRVLDPKMLELIIKATELNPRDVKRFINSIVISQEIYGQKIDDIEKIIVIQAFYFHGDKWLEFLKLLIPYKQRIEFGMHFFLWSERERWSTTISNLYDLKISLRDDKNERKDVHMRDIYTNNIYADKSIRDIYKKLIDIGDDDLFAFLRVSIKTLLRIDKIERYLRVLDPIGTTSKAEMREKEIDNEKLLDLMRNGKVEEFNDHPPGEILIHLPFENLAGWDLRKFDLSHSMLFDADLSGTNLSKANLFWADLIRANLSRANLSEADLSWANLYEARLYEADLSGANLSLAILIRANLSRANLSEADLSEALLYEAKLSGADLSGADLSDAKLSLADLSQAKLLNTVIIKPEFDNVLVNKYTDFSNSIIDDPDFLKYLHEKGCQNIPNEIKNKQELREELLRRNFSQGMIDSCLRTSQLPGQ
jgi:hypothetical protein